MADMTNVSDIDLKVKISMGPGQKPMITKLKPGETRDFPDGYCKTVKGPGPDRLPCILSRANSHNGVPALVPAEEAEEARARYLRVSAALAGRAKDPSAEIRRLEAELAAHRVAAKAATPKAAKAPAPTTAPADDGDDLVDMTTPQTAPQKPARKSRAKAKG
jgi:hypothetical protein